MTTWHNGRSRLRSRLAESYLPLDLFLKEVRSARVHRVPGTAVFMSGNPNGTPIALLHNLRHNQVLHERIVILTVLNTDVPFVLRNRAHRAGATRSGHHAGPGPLRVHGTAQYPGSCSSGAQG